MKRFTPLSIVLAILGQSLAKPSCPISKWRSPEPHDRRAPCPMLNSLANHGYLPHDGKDITAERTICALNTALNISEDLAAFLFDFAVTTNPTPNATSFDLDHLSRHNILEHDASLSRADFDLGGDASTFNETVFAETRSYWKGPIISLQEAADARIARIKTSNTTNPAYSLSDLGSSFSVGETAAYLMFFGDGESGSAKKEWVEYFFENERLPIELGWSTPSASTEQDQLFEMMDRIVNATGVSSEVVAEILARADIHSGRTFGNVS